MRRLCFCLRPCLQQWIAAHTVYTGARGQVSHAARDTSALSDSEIRSDHSSFHYYLRVVIWDASVRRRRCLELLSVPSLETCCSVVSPSAVDDWQCRTGKYSTKQQGRKTDRTARRAIMPGPVVFTAELFGPSFDSAVFFLSNSRSLQQALQRCVDTISHDLTSRSPSLLTIIARRLCLSGVSCWNC